MTAQLERTWYLWERTRDVSTLIIVGLTIYWGLLPSTSQWVLAFLLIAFLAAYASVYTPAFKRNIADQHTRKLVYLGVLIGLWFGLILFDSVFIMLLFTVLALIFSLMPLKWSLGLSLGVSLLTLVKQFILSDNALGPAEAIAIVLSASAMIFIVLFLDALSRQNDERAKLISELQATRDDLAQAQHAAGVSAERARIAREIHDTLAQDLASIVAHIESAQATHPDIPAPARNHIQQAQQAARDGLTEARRFVWALRPDILEGDGLAGAIQRTAEKRITPPTNFELTVTGEAIILPTPTAVTLLRIATEAMTNASKHAQADTIAVTLSYMGTIIALDIFDDGIGFDLNEGQQSAGFGLKGMQQRVEAAGGTLTIETDKNEGSTIAVAIPIQEET